MKILVTGANGFIGSFLVREGMKRGYEMWAAVRKESDCTLLEGCDAKILVLDYSSNTALCNAFRNHSKRHGVFNAIVHAAGVTKCSNVEDFESINYALTKRMIEALIATNTMPKQFVFISTLGTYGPIHEKSPYRPICEEDRQMAQTLYGKSKLKAEEYIKSVENLNYTIFQPTAVYGPGDKDLLLMAKTIRWRVNMISGWRREYISFVYVADLVNAILLALEHNVYRRCYIISDGNEYNGRDFGAITAQEYGYKWLLNLYCPLPLVWLVCNIAHLISRAFGSAFTLNRDKYHIVAQRNWRCNITALQQELGYTPKYSLKQGIKETMDWYKLHHWI